MTVSVPTLGCKLNQAETEALSRAFHLAGFRIGRPADPADIVIVNSCTVTGRSDAKSRHATRHAAAASPEALVILTGCYAEVENEDLEAEFGKELVGVVGQSRKALLLGFAAAAADEPGFAGFSRVKKYEFFRMYLERTRTTATDGFSLATGEPFFRTRAFLKIQDGCDRRCAYCRVPLARGPSVSLDFGLVLERMGEAVARGAAEIVLTGVNICSYRSGERDLADIITEAVRRARGVRFRLSSLEPDALTPRLLDALAFPTVCQHFHLSVQSGSAAVLARMRRRYGPDQLCAGAAEVRRRRPDAFIAADVIVGFPGESDAEFVESRSLIEELPVDALHVFPFSPRPGTAAYLLPGRVRPETVKERVRTLIASGARMTDRFLSGWRDKTVEVVLEKKTGAGTWTGSSRHSVKCRVEGVPFAAGGHGRLVRASIVETGKLSRAVFMDFPEVAPEFDRPMRSESLTR